MKEEREKKEKIESFQLFKSDKWKWKWSRLVVSDSSDPMDCSLPGSSVHGIFQAKVLESWKL